MQNNIIEVILKKQGSFTKVKKKVIEIYSMIITTNFLKKVKIISDTPCRVIEKIKKYLIKMKSKFEINRWILFSRII